MSAPTNFWSSLIEVNRVVDDLFAKCLRAVEPSQPIGREIPFWTSIEARFDNLPTTFATVAAPNSDILAGNNVKRPVFTNGGSRVYVREISFGTFTARMTTGSTNDSLTRNTNLGRFPVNFRWNFETSITNRKYCDRRVLANAGGRQLAGNHLAFREPLVIEPRETLVFDCELLSFGMTQVANSFNSAVVAMYLAGYREGV